VSRLTYLGLAIGTVAIGLVVHFLDTSRPTAAGDIFGDALWATVVFWLISAIAPAARLGTRGSVAFAIAVAVECSQLYHAPALDAVRGTMIGRLVLGTGFDPRDLVSYAGGVLAAALVDRLLRAPNRSIVP
jgi:hypothetical protein